MTLDEIRREVGAWLDENWSPDLSLIEWRKLLLDARWAAPSWPVEYFGRGFDAAEASIVSDVFRAKNAVGAAQSGSLAGETIIAHGSHDQKLRFLPKILTGEHLWCQLFSEPGSGSDLAGLTTKAELIDGRWVLNGQKVWNTNAHRADFGILVARSNWDLPKHQGMSYFLIDMKQPGVEVRPLKQMNGHASFNEVFMTDALVPPENMVGEEGEGWAIATTTLSIERQGFARSRRGQPRLPAGRGRIYEEYAEEQRLANEPYSWYPQREGRVDLVMKRAKETGAIKNPVVRQEIAKLMCMSTGARLSAGRAEQRRRSGRREAVPSVSVGKLGASMIARQAAHVHTMISGTDAMLSGPESAEDGLIAEVLVSVPAISIAGGTDEIQRNIIAERVLGMPKEQRMDRGPFRDIKRN